MSSMPRTAGRFDPAQLQVEGEAPPKPRHDAGAGDGQPVRPGRDSAGGQHSPATRTWRCRRASARATRRRLRKFCSVFPDMFYMEARGRNYFDTSKDQGRYLSAGFHNVMGYFRDDEPLYELLLDDQQQKAIGRNVAGNGFRRLDHRPDVRAVQQLRRARQRDDRGRRRPGRAPRYPEDKEVTSEVKIRQLESSYLDQAKGGSAGRHPGHQGLFRFVNTTVRSVEKTQIDGRAGPACRRCCSFAARAYRRPLTRLRRTICWPITTSCRDKDGLDHEEAMRETIVEHPDVARLLLPHRSRRSAGHGRSSAVGLRSGQPAELFPVVERAGRGIAGPRRGGDLHEPKVIAAQARRMLKDPRIRGAGRGVRRQLARFPPF